MLDAALLRTSHDKARAARTVEGMLGYLNAAGAFAPPDLILKIVSFRAETPESAAAATPPPPPSPLPLPGPLEDPTIGTRDTASARALLSAVTLRLAGVLPSAAVSLPSWRGIPLVVPRAYGGGLSGVILNFPSVLIEAPRHLADLLAVAGAGGTGEAEAEAETAAAATAKTALGNAVNQALEAVPLARARALVAATPHARPFETLSTHLGLGPSDSLFGGLRLHANHGGAVRVHAPLKNSGGGCDNAVLPRDHVLLALHLTMPMERGNLRLVPGDANFNCILYAAGAALVASERLSFRKPHLRGTPRPAGGDPNLWWHCRVRPLPLGGEEPTPGVRTLPPDWKTDISPVQRASIIAQLRERYNADLAAKLTSV